MRRWKNNITGKIHLVHEQWEPIEETIKFDDKFWKDLDPEIAKQVGDKRIAHGVLVQCGWMIRGSGNVWLGMPFHVKDQFTDMGEASLQDQHEELEIKSTQSLKD